MLWYLTIHFFLTSCMSSLGLHLVDQDITIFEEGMPDCEFRFFLLASRGLIPSWNVLSLRWRSGWVSGGWSFNYLWLYLTPGSAVLGLRKENPLLIPGSPSHPVDVFVPRLVTGPTCCTVVSSLKSFTLQGALDKESFSSSLYITQKLSNIISHEILW